MLLTSSAVIRCCSIAPLPQLYEQILAENEKLKAQLRDTDLELSDLKLQLEKATQVWPPPSPLDPMAPPLQTLPLYRRSTILWTWDHHVLNNTNTAVID